MTGDDVRALRKRAGMTQKQLGRRIGTSDVTVRRWEIGIHKPIGVYVMLLEDLERELDSGAELDRGRAETLDAHGNGPALDDTAR